MIGFLSPGIGRIKFLSSFLGDDVQRVRPWVQSSDYAAIAGWGLKETSIDARGYAEKNNLSYLSLEDGFLRSLGLGVEGALSCSMIVDHRGIYYDASRASDLELLIKKGCFSDDELKRAEHGIELLRRYRLAKYNHAPDYLETITLTDKPKVLVVDQTLGDASIEFGLADASHFELMLKTAVDDNPEAEILVKTHPDVITGKKTGYLTESAKSLNCTLISEDISPWALLDVVEKVFVVTSQLGFEALLADKVVHCFGVPFYAGWGLTKDYQTVGRRDVNRSLSEVFASAYFHYCRYINPYTGERCEFEDTVSLLADQKRMRERYKGDWQAIGFSKWKQGFVTNFFGSSAVIKYHKNVPKSSEPNWDEERWVIWSSKDEQKVALKDRNNVWFMEDGFLRSVGLGANMVTPLSLVIDSRGIYYDPTIPSDLEHYLNYYEFSDDLLVRSRWLIETLVELKLSKYNVGNSGHLSLPADKRILLIPGQVETDASIRKGAQGVTSNLGLLKAVRAACPDAYIIYKPHPDVLAGARLGNSEQHLGQEYYDQLVTDIGMPELLEQVDEVHTMTSLTGFEALLREVPVTTYGLPFYAGWGLTQDRYIIERRQRTLTLEQLVAAVLILYPVYIDPETGDQINVETAISLINRNRNKKPKTTLYARLRQLTRKPY